MTRRVFDSTRPTDIPPGVLRAGYCDGRFGPNGPDPNERWNESDLAQCLCQIATQPGHARGQVIDVEQFDIAPQQAAEEIKRRLAAGISSVTVYVNRGNRTTVENGLIGAGILTDQALLWVATLDGTRTVTAGPYRVIAVQWANSAISGGHYDISDAADFWPGVDTLTEENEMELLELHEGDEGQWIPGCGSATQFNAVVDEGEGLLQVGAVGLDGTPIPLTLPQPPIPPMPPEGVVQLYGNQPNVRGPIQWFGNLTSLGVTEPCSLYLANVSTHPCTITVNLH